MDSASALPANPPSPLPRVESTRTRWLRARYALSGYAMIMPAAVLLIVFVVAPGRRLRTGHNAGNIRVFIAGLPG